MLFPDPVFSLFFDYKVLVLLPKDLNSLTPHFFVSEKLFGLDFAKILLYITSHVIGVSLFYVPRGEGTGVGGLRASLSALFSRYN